jgi:hypothetical protein
MTADLPMSSADPGVWSDYLKQTLHCYADSLVQQVAAKLIRPRSQWPHGELIERCVAAMGNAAILDRRLEELPVPCRRLLSCISHSGQPRWKLGNLLEILAALGFNEGPQSIVALFEAGLLCPDLLRNGLAPGAPRSEGGRISWRLRSFEQWLGQGAATEFMTFAHPSVLARALDGELGLPSCQTGSVPVGGIHEADGLEWPLRLAAIWQQTAASPLRRTMQGDFFKRDLDRLRSDALLAAPPSDGLAELPDPGLLAVAWALAEGILEVDQADLRAAVLPATWDEGLPSALAALWPTLPLIDTWNAKDGWTGASSGVNPYPSAGLLSLLLLAQLPDDGWACPEDIETWILAHHPFWQGNRRQPSPHSAWVTTFLLGLAYPLRMLQAGKDSSGKWLVRLSPSGRRMLRLTGPQPENGPPTPPVRQTLLVQPNLEIIVYRQALAPALIARLSQFAAWKSLGAACTLHLQADSVYRGLESGLTLETMLQTLEQYGMRATPPAVVESLRTWADKRERISVYPSATLFEFATSGDLDEALARGVPGIRLSDRLLAVAGDRDIDFRHFRLTGTRDYGLPPEKCVEVDSDGVTLAVDLARSDLLLETEIKRFAEPLESTSVNGYRRYRLTPASLAGGRDNGMGQRYLEEWFLQRAGRPLSPAAQLLLNGSTLPPVDLRSQLVVQVATPEIADGLLQWSGTRALIQDRLGPTALVVAADNVELLKERLAGLGIGLRSSVGS